MRRIEVEWEDAQSKGGWGTARDFIAALVDAPIQKSVGYEIECSKRGIVVVQTRQVEGEMMADALFIPRKYVLSVRELQEVPE